MHDYYAILGVRSDADLVEIKKAYRKKAHECHPDRGGSHEAIMLVNEAWFVLSDPARRAEYDSVRQSSSADAGKDWAVTVSAVRSRAQEYPRDWTEFTSWMEAALDDIANARYEGAGERVGLAVFPKILNSRSGQWAITIGACIGWALFFGTSAGRGMMKNTFDQNQIKGFLALAIPGAFGAWVGYFIHWLFNQFAVRSIRAKRLREESRVVACPKCGQQLRIPHHDHTLTVTCQACRDKVDVEPSLPPAPKAWLTRHNGVCASIGAVVGFLVAINLSMQIAQQAATKLLKDIPESTIQLVRTGDLEKRIHQMEGFAIAHGGEEVMDEKHKKSLKELRATRDFFTQLVHQADTWTDSTYLDRIEMFPMVYVICLAIGAGLGGLIGFGTQQEPPDAQRSCSVSRR